MVGCLNENCVSQKFTCTARRLWTHTHMPAFTHSTVSCNENIHFHSLAVYLTPSLTFITKSLNLTSSLKGESKSKTTVSKSTKYCPWLSAQFPWPLKPSATSPTVTKQSCQFPSQLLSFLCLTGKVTALPFNWLFSNNIFKIELFHLQTLLIL